MKATIPATANARLGAYPKRVNGSSPFSSELGFRGPLIVSQKFGSLISSQNSQCILYRVRVVGRHIARYPTYLYGLIDDNSRVDLLTAPKGLALHRTGGIPSQITESPSGVSR